MRYRLQDIGVRCGLWGGMICGVALQVANAFVFLRVLLVILQVANVFVEDDTT